MLEGLVDVVRDGASSPWVYAALFALAAIDAFFPVVPSEGAVITVGVFAATGEAALVPVIVAAGAGAFTGDHVAYALGGAATRRLPVARAGSRRRRALAWAERVLEKRGGSVLVVGRYVPGGRVAVTMAAGSVRYPLRRFTPYVALAGASWATYAALVGFLGGATFEEDPIKALLLGFALAGTAALAVEVVRHLRGRRAPTGGPATVDVTDVAVDVTDAALSGRPPTAGPPAPRPGEVAAAEGDPHRHPGAARASGRSPAR